MPQFDESFLSDCALAERWGFYSYTLKPTPPTTTYSTSHDDDHHHQRHVEKKKQRQSWSPRDSNNNTSHSSNTSNISNSGNTLHSIKFHRRRKYKKLPRLASLSTPLIPQEMDDVNADVAVDATDISHTTTWETSLPSTPVPLKNAVCRK